MVSQVQNEVEVRKNMSPVMGIAQPINSEQAAAKY